jgi:hypothetical protein
METVNACVWNFVSSTFVVLNWGRQNIGRPI